MSIHDRKLRSLTVSRVFTTPYIASPEPTRGIQKFISHLKEPFISSSNREEFLLVLTCDHVAVLRGGNGDAGDLGTRSSSRGSGPLTLTSADSSPTSSLTDNSFDASSSQSLVLSVALSHLTQVTADGSSVTLEFVCSSGHKAATTDPFSPSPAFPVLSAIGDRAKSIVGESNKAGRSGHHMGKQVSTLRSVLPLQQVVLYAESEQVRRNLCTSAHQIIENRFWYSPVDTMHLHGTPKLTLASVSLYFLSAFRMPLTWLRRCRRQCSASSTPFSGWTVACPSTRTSPCASSLWTRPIMPTKGPALVRMQSSPGVLHGGPL